MPCIRRLPLSSRFRACWLDPGAARIWVFGLVISMMLVREGSTGSRIACCSGPGTSSIPRAYILRLKGGSDAMDMTAARSPDPAASHTATRDKETDDHGPNNMKEGSRSPRIDR
jgi:hypothetical protein